MSAETVESLCEKAQKAVAAGQPEMARQFFLQALSLRSDLPDVHYGLATVCYMLKDYPGAVYHFKEVTRLDPLRAGAFINLGAVYNKLDQIDEALAALRKGIHLDKTRAEGFYNLGLVYRRQGQLDLATQAYREATKANPRMTDAHYNLANLYLERGQFQQAIQHYQQALEHRPRWDKALRGLEQARAALAEPQLETAGEERIDAGPPTELMPNPDRDIDPQVHGTVLVDLHRATIDTQNLGSDLAQVLHNEIEPAIKLLSSCLLQTHKTSTEIDQCVQKVEEAIERWHAMNHALGESMQKVQKQGQKLLER